MTFLGWIILLIVIAAVIVAVAAWFYERATNEVALVRTGVGGRDVVIDGGTLAVPYFHEITRVNMQTIRMTVGRAGEQAPITKDRLRVDMTAEFYVSVQPEADAVARAAQTLGKRLFQGEALKGLLDGMMIDALRSEAAKVTMDELHENRSAYVAAVQAVLAEPMAKYGLQIDSVSLTALDQTPFAALDENNAFNAVGMRKLAEVIAKSKKERAEIESDSDVSVRKAAMEATRRKLEIDLEERRAEIAQAQEVETLLAAQLAEVAAKKADAERESAFARIKMEQEIQAADIAREQAIQEAEIAQRRALGIAERERNIMMATKSQEESRAQVEADTARAEAVKAEAAVETARQLAEADRAKALALLKAEEIADAAAASARIAARSEKATAEDLLAAKEAEAQATKAVELARAEAELARIQAQNARSDAIVAMELEKSRLEAMPKIVAEMVKPAEKIKGISINHVTGLGGSGGGDAGPKAPVSQALDSILDMAVQLPALKKIGDAVGVNIEDAISSVDGDKKA